MKTKFFITLFLLGLTVFAVAQNSKLNVVILGAHPDDADGRTGGTAIQFAQMGHNVLFVSVTNGDAGHYKYGREELAKIRKKEAAEAGKRFGVTYKVLKNHDGKLVPSLDVRHQIIKVIREWNADLVIGHRPNDYHPDHRNVGVLMQDAAYLVIVPSVVPDVPPLTKNPVFMYIEDGFQKPTPHRPDICVDISDVYEQKIYAMSAHASQYFDWLPWTSGKLATVPKEKEERLEWLAKARKPKINEAERKKEFDLLVRRGKREPSNPCRIVRNLRVWKTTIEGKIEETFSYVERISDAGIQENNFVDIDVAFSSNLVAPKTGKVLKYTRHPENFYKYTGEQK